MLVNKVFTLFVSILVLSHADTGTVTSVRLTNNTLVVQTYNGVQITTSDDGWGNWFSEERGGVDGGAGPFNALGCRGSYCDDMQKYYVFVRKPNAVLDAYAFSLMLVLQKCQHLVPLGLVFVPMEVAIPVVLALQIQSRLIFHVVAAIVTTLTCSVLH